MKRIWTDEKAWGIEWNGKFFALGEKIDPPVKRGEHYYLVGRDGKRRASCIALCRMGKIWK